MPELDMLTTMPADIAYEEAAPYFLKAGTMRLTISEKRMFEAGRKS